MMSVHSSLDQYKVNKLVKINQRLVGSLEQIFAIESQGGGQNKTTRQIYAKIALQG